MTTRAARLRRFTIDWTAEGEIPGRLWSTSLVTVNGVYVHVTALRVIDTPEGVQVAWNPDLAPEVEAVQTLVDGRLEAHTIPGQPGLWVLAVFSHGA